MTKRVLLAACALLLLAGAGCRIENERTLILPWLLKKSTYRGFGGFGGGWHQSYFAKHWGFWRRLDAWNAVVLDPEHVLIYSNEGIAVLRRGSLATTTVCPGMQWLSLPPGLPAADCIEPVWREQRLVAIRWRRFGVTGREVDEGTVSPSGEARVFAPSLQVFAYDDEAHPYFLTLNPEAARDYRIMPRDCALVSTRAEGEPWIAPASFTADECDRPAAWEGVVGRRLFAPGTRPGRP
jgi:hypothetical protein